MINMNTEYKPESSFTDADQTVLTSDTTKSEKSSPTAFLGEGTSQQVQEIWAKISSVLGDLPEYVSDFFKSYQRPLITVGLIFGAIVSAKLVLAMLGAINEIPLLSPTFELIGLGYSVWFIYRYLLRASNRQELISDFNGLKDQVLGKHI